MANSPELHSQHNVHNMTSLRGKIEGVHVGDHICSLHTDEPSYHSGFLQFLSDGLIQNERVFYLTDLQSQNKLVQDLKASGLPTSQYLQSGQLYLDTADNTYLSGGSFNPNDTLAQIVEAIKASQSQGYPRVRFAVDHSSWLNRGNVDLQSWINFEHMVKQESLRDLNCIGFCQYHMSHLPADFINSVIEAHPLCHVDTKLTRNPYYTPIELQHHPKSSEALLKHRWESLHFLEQQDELISRLYDKISKLEDFSFMLAHEIIGPLRSAKMICDILEAESERNEIHKEHVKDLQKALNVGYETIKSLEKMLSINQVENTKFKVNIRDAYNLAFRDLKTPIEESACEISFTDIDPITLAVNPIHLHQLLMNLVKNSIKYKKNEQTPQIKIWTEDTPTAVIIKIQDNGIGIKPEYLNSIFKPFMRIDESKNRNLSSGMGMGLTICQRIMELYSGKIEVESSSAGTTVSLIFPSVYKLSEEGKKL